MAATVSIHGKDGTVVGVTGVTEITEFSVELTLDANEATSIFSAGVRQFIKGLAGASGSLAAKGKTIPPTGDVSLVLQTGVIVGSTRITGSAIITNVNVTNPHDDVVSYTADFTFDDGAVVDVTT